MRHLVAAAALGLAACGPYPNDVEGTLRSIEAQHRIRVGFADLPANARPLTEAYLARLEKATGAAKIEAREGSTEELFAQLEAGRIDLVVAEVAEDSPWINDVSVIEPLSRRKLGERELGLSPVARNGENRWIMLLEREMRNMKAAS